MYFANPPLLESLRLRYFDQLIVNQPVNPNNIYTINIDESAITEHGQWPFARSVYGSMIEDLYARGAGLVIWNVLMAEEDRAGDDLALSMTMYDYPVILTLLEVRRIKMKRSIQAPLLSIVSLVILYHTWTGLSPMFEILKTRLQAPDSSIHTQRWMELQEERRSSSNLEESYIQTSRWKHCVFLPMIPPFKSSCRLLASTNSEYHSSA